MLKPIRLDILRVLREQANISQENAASFCGLTGRQGRLSFGAWERGESTPHSKRRARFIVYLWDRLGLRNDHRRFEEIWNILVEEWQWDSISDREWSQLTTASRPPSRLPMTQQTDVTETTSSPTALQNKIYTASMPFQAPGLASHFVGRQQEMTYLRHRLLERPADAVYALVGMGGVGKTALATCVAHALRSHFADGVLWGYEATGDPLDILNHWAQAYGCDFSSLGDLQNRAAALRGLLADKHTLIVVDDVTSIDRVRLLLPNGRQCAVLITTRNEEVAIGLGAQVLKIDELPVEDGVAIFTQIVGEQRVAGETEQVQTICERLKNLPLAVEIAAQFLKVRSRHSLRDLAERLENAQQRIALTIADRGVRASFLVSWDALDAAQRGLFSDMALFAGRSFTTEALAAIGEIDRRAAQDQLERLCALSLVKEEGQHYYRQHQLLADFAQAQLTDDSVRHSHARRRMANYYLAFAQQNRGDRQRLTTEWDNLSAGMQAAKDDAAWRQVIDYADALTEAWLILGEYQRAQQAFAWTMEAAAKLNAQEILTRYQLHQAYLWCEQGQTTEASTILRDSLSKAEALGDQILIARAQYLLARLALEQANYEETDELLSSCGALYKQNHDQLGWARTKHLRAIMHYRVSEFAQCEAILQTVLPIYEQYQDINGKAEVLRFITDSALMQLKNEQAQRYADVALQFAEEHNITAELGECYINKAIVARRMEAFPEAIDYVERAAALLLKTGKQSSIANAYYEKSRVLDLLGKTDAAIAAAKQSLAIVEQVGELYNCVFALHYLATLYLKSNNVVTGRQLMVKAHDLAKSISHPMTSDIEEQLGMPFPEDRKVYLSPRVGGM